MTTIIFDEGIQSHKVLRKLLSTHHSDKEATASDYTEFTIIKNPEELLTYAKFGFYSYIMNTTSCNRTIPWFIR